MELATGDEYERRRQFAQQMISRDQVFIDHPEETILTAVLALHGRYHYP